MAIVWNEFGENWATGTISLQPALPSGVLTGHMMLLYVGAKPYDATIATPPGWTLITAGSGSNGTTPVGLDTGSVVWATFYRAYQAGDVAPTGLSVTGGDTAMGVTVSCSKSANRMWLAPVAAKGSDTTSGTGFSLTMDADPGIAADDMLAHFASIAGNDATFATPTITATSATIGTVTEATQLGSLSGNDMASAVSYALCNSGTGTAAPVCGWTLSAAQTGGGSIVRLRTAATVELMLLAPYLTSDARS